MASPYAWPFSTRLHKDWRMNKTTDGSILVERARVARHDRHPGAQHVLAFAAPGIAERAAPGSFVHMDCGPEWLLRRPMSIMSAAGGEIEILFKQVGHGT